MLLPTIDMTPYVAGQKFTVSFKSAGLTAEPSKTKNPPQIVIHNESGTGGRIQFDSGTTIPLPAGAWLPAYPITPGESGFTFFVDYVLPNAPVKLMYVQLLMPGESAVPVLTLGNSPIGIGGTLSITAQNVVNTDTVGNTVGTGDAFISATPNGLGYQSVGIGKNGGFFFRGDAKDFAGNAQFILDMGLVGSQSAQMLLGVFQILAYGESLAETYEMQGPGGLRLGGVGSHMKGWQVVTGTGNGTFSHTLGTTPTAVIIQPTALSTTPWSVGSYSSTQFTVSGLSSAILWRGVALAS